MSKCNEEVNRLAFILTSTQMVRMTLQAFDAAGNPAVIENVVWSSSDPTVFSVVPDAENPLAAVAIATGTLGLAQVQVTADARIGEGEVLLQGILEIEVISGEAVNVVIVPGVPEDKPPVTLRVKARK